MLADPVLVGFEVVLLRQAVFVADLRDELEQLQRRIAVEILPVGRVVHDRARDADRKRLVAQLEVGQGKGHRRSTPTGPASAPKSGPSRNDCTGRDKITRWI